VRTLREGFQILDRDSDGTVNREDVADMLNQLGRSISTAHDRREKAALDCHVLTSEFTAV
jgi:Ca2+-binding EF-hand superfamily protein